MITTTITPESQTDLADAVREAAVGGQAVYPLGGQTASDDGFPPTIPGVSLSMAKLNRIIDYDAHDMSITVEAGTTMAELAKRLAVEGQELPIDVPRADKATLGGVVATNFNGPRRFGLGALRDYIIGVTAVDGRGVAFRAGGRVVKNVAGYDFCKMLCGSLGTLAVLTQFTLKVRPLPVQTAMVGCTLDDWAQADAVLTSLNTSIAGPVAVELLAGSTHRLIGSSKNGSVALAVRLEGTPPELTTMQETLIAEWTTGNAKSIQVLPDDAGGTLYSKIVEFPDRGLPSEDRNDDASPLILKIAVPPSRVTAICQSLLEADPHCAILAHAGNGIVFARFATFDANDWTKVITDWLRPQAVLAGGSLVVLRTKVDGLTRQQAWGDRADAQPWVTKVKQKFDPNNILNPGRF